MIVSAVLDVLFNVFSALTSAINIPAMPAEVAGYMADAMEWITLGIGILGAYTHLSYLLILFGIVIAIDIAITLYHFVMWVIKKIPFLGMQ